MANRFNSPDVQFCDASGLPYAGGTLSFYASGTSTPQNTYSDSALTIANLNPVVLDSAGRAGSIFLQNLPYKVVLADVNTVQIWTFDPVWSSDYSTFASFQPINGNPNGRLAGTAGTVGALPGSSAAWDYINNILYVATTTGTSTTTVWTAVNGAAPTANVPTPQGYLTCSNDSSNPIITSDVLASGSIYYTPYVGNIIPIYTGTVFSSSTFTQLVLTLSASHAADTLYDVFVFNNSGVLTLVTGPAWTNSTAGTCTRGTGASTTQIQRLNGLWVNQVQISGRNGASTFTIAANMATYVGTIYTDHTAGTVSCHRAWGQNRKFGVWNAYNRVPIIVQEGDPTASWAGSGVRASNTSPAAWSSTVFNVGSGTAANGITVLCGLPEECIECKFVQAFSIVNATGGNAIGINSVTVISGKAASALASTASGFGMGIEGTAYWNQPPTLGLTTVCALDNVATGGGTVTTLGTNAHMVLSVEYRG